MEILNNDDILRQEILKDANTKADRLIKKANRESDEIKSDYKKHLEDFKNELKSNIDLEIEEQKKLIFASIDIEANKEIINYSGNLVSSVFKQIRNDVLENKIIDYRKFITFLIIDAAKKINEEKYIIEAGKNQLSLITIKDLSSIKLEKGKITSVIENNNIKDIILYSENKKLMSYISIDKFIENLIEDERINVYNFFIKS